MLHFLSANRSLSHLTKYFFFFLLSPFISVTVLCLFACSDYLGGGMFVLLCFFSVEKTFLTIIFIHGNNPLTCVFKLFTPGNLSHNGPNFVSGNALLKIFMIISCYFF